MASPCVSLLCSRPSLGSSISEQTTLFLYLHTFLLFNSVTNCTSLLLRTHPVPNDAPSLTATRYTHPGMFTRDDKKLGVFLFHVFT
jgi:hypothetical protein